MTTALKAAAEQVLLQGLSLLNEVSETEYALILSAPYAASVGKHYRHVLDHFTCLLRGMASGRIDYDARARDLRIENDHDYALAATLELIEALRSITPTTITQSCLVEYTVGYGDRNATLIPTTLARELAFSISHAVHHYALIRLICAALQVELPLEFGVAPSTLNYQTQAAG